MTDLVLHFIKSNHGRRLVTEKHLAMLKGGAKSKSGTYVELSIANHPFKVIAISSAAWKQPALQSLGVC